MESQLLAHQVVVIQIDLSKDLRPLLPTEIDANGLHEVLEFVGTDAIQLRLTVKEERRLRISLSRTAVCFFRDRQCLGTSCTALTSDFQD